MNNSFNQKKINFIIDFVYISSIILIIYIFLKYVLTLIMPFVLAILLSVLSEPLIDFVTSKTNIKRSAGSVISVIGIIIIILGIIAVISIVVCSQMDTLFSFLPKIISNISSYTNDLSLKPDTNFFEKIIIYLGEYLENLNLESLKNSGITDRVMLYFADIFKSLPQFVIATIAMFAFAVLFSSSYPKIKKIIKERFSYSKRIIIHNIKASIICVVLNFIKSYSILMLITFVELSIAFLIFNIQPAVPLALIISLVDILPIFGVGTIMVPWGIICLLTGDFSLGAIIFAIYIIITVIRQVIEPKIIGKSIGLPPIITLPAMFIGLGLLGIKGLFISPMVVTVVYDLTVKGYIKLWNKY